MHADPQMQNLRVRSRSRSQIPSQPNPQPGPKYIVPVYLLRVSKPTQTDTEQETKKVLMSDRAFGGGGGGNITFFIIGRKQQLHFRGKVIRTLFRHHEAGEKKKLFRLVQVHINKKAVEETKESFCILQSERVKESFSASSGVASCLDFLDFECISGLFPPGQRVGMSSKTTRAGRSSGPVGPKSGAEEPNQ